MTISTPQPEYVTETHEVVDAALDRKEESPSTEYFKLVPSTQDWMEARTDALMHICPICHAPVFTIDIDQHTSWHEMLAKILQILAG